MKALANSLLDFLASDAKFSIRGLLFSFLFIVYSRSPPNSLLLGLLLEGSYLLIL